MSAQWRSARLAARSRPIASEWSARLSAADWIACETSVKMSLRTS
ncbi:hypothetical protein ACFQ0M_42725 [Kitasatospora aburaviensis]